MKIFKVDKDAWLISKDNNKSWMLTFYNGIYSLLKDGVVHRYDDNTIDSFVDRRKLLTTRKQRVSTNRETFIFGFPVKHTNVECVDDGSGLPLFKKNKTSEAVYCAGYYLIKVNNCWSPRFCPKQTTLKTCKAYLGPYINTDEMNEVYQKLKT